MAIQVTISAHASDKDAEKRMLDALRDGVAGLDAEVYSATATTQHHGTVNLVDENTGQQNPPTA